MRQKKCAPPLIRYLLIATATFVFSDSAFAFKILSPITQGCHERLLLGSLNQEKTGFSGDGQPSTSALLQLFAARIPASQIPDDDATQGLIQEMTNRYGWDGIDISTRYVLASFVAGVRDPDTDGFSITNFNVLRDTQIQDSGQSAHALRQIADDGLAGNVTAIQRTRDLITSIMKQVTAEWNASSLPIRQVRWTYAFYATNNVTIFAPAYDLGEIVHTIQDSYAHTIRDDSFAIISVANYIEVMIRSFDESRDGPAHSERLDQCNLDDAFDAMRISEARKQTANVFVQLTSVLQAQSSDLSPVQAALDTIFTYRDGCDLSNNYCGATWYQKSQEGTTTPYSVGCGRVASNNIRFPPSVGRFPPSENQRWPTLFSLLAPLGVVIYLKVRSTRTKVMLR